MRQSIDRIRSALGHISWSLCVVCAGAFLALMGAFNLAFATSTDKCGGFVVYDSSTHLWYGPYCKSNGCVATCGTQQVNCSPGVSGTTCYCPDQGVPAMECEAALTAASFKCCPPTCATGTCTAWMHFDPPEGYRPEDYTPPPPDPSNPNLYWLWCKCN